MSPVGATTDVVVCDDGDIFKYGCDCACLWSFKCSCCDVITNGLAVMLAVVVMWDAGATEKEVKEKLL